MDYTEYRFDYSAKNKDFYFALFSDFHIDSKTFSKNLFIKDAEKYKEKGARFFINGDLFDSILCTDKKRYSRSGDIFDEDAQINARIDYAVSVLKYYADYIDFVGIGNHEASVVKYDHVDIVKLFLLELSKYRDKKLPPIQRGTYQGFLRLLFNQTNSGSGVMAFDIYREHGKGGNAPVTKGTINIQRLHTTYLADLYWLGHSHTSIVDKTAWTISPNKMGKIIKKPKLSVITSGYSDSFIQNDLNDKNCYHNSFAEEKFLYPSGLGSALLHLSIARGHRESFIESEIIS